MVASGWQTSFAQLIEGLAPCFRTPASLHRAEEYLRGLLSPIARHNNWQLSEVSGEPNPWALQQFLSKAVWRSADVRDVLQEYVAEKLGAEDAVLDVDETGFLKKGEHSAGVQRQYSGTAGRIENCQIGVFIAYAGRGHALVDGRLYLPKSWIEDEARRREAHVPEETAFRTKPEIALEMILHARHRLPFSFVTGDCVYGDDRRLRLRLEEEGLAHVLGVSGKEYVDTSFGHRERVSRVLDEARRAPEEIWHRLPSGQGSKGPRLYDWALRPLVSPRPGWRRSLLVRRSLEGELSAFACAAPEETSLERLVAVQGRRWEIESCFEEAKQQVGLDESEVRRFDAWHRHIALSMLAHAFLAKLSAEQSPPPRVKKRGSVRSMEGFLRSRGLA